MKEYLIKCHLHQIISFKIIQSLVFHMSLSFICFLSKLAYPYTTVDNNLKISTQKVTMDATRLHMDKWTEIRGRAHPYVQPATRQSTECTDHERSAGLEQRRSSDESGGSKTVQECCGQGQLHGPGSAGLSTGRLPRSNKDGRTRS